MSTDKTRYFYLLFFLIFPFCMFCLHVEGELVAWYDHTMPIHNLRVVSKKVIMPSTSGNDFKILMWNAKILADIHFLDPKVYIFLLSYVILNYSLSPHALEAV